MLFEPYYPMSAETDENGNKSASKKYSRLKFNRSEGDKFLDSFFAGDYYTEGYIKRLRDCYKKVRMELNEVFDSIVKSIAVMAAIAIPVIAAAGIYAPALAVGLVGSKFVGLSGAALTSACLAYLGGGAVAVGGAGMAGGMATIGWRRGHTELLCRFRSCGRGGGCDAQRKELYNSRLRQADGSVEGDFPERRTRH